MQINKRIIDAAAQAAIAAPSVIGLEYCVGAVPALLMAGCAAVLVVLVGTQDIKLKRHSDETKGKVLKWRNSSQASKVLAAKRHAWERKAQA